MTMTEQTKNILLGAIILGIAAVVLVVYYFTYPQNLRQDSQDLYTELQDVESATIAESTTYSNIDVTYPVPDVDVVHENIAQYVSARTANFTESAEQLMNQEDRPPSASSAVPELVISYDVIVGPYTVGYVLEEYEYMLGAHGNTTYATFLYNSAGERVTLQDILQPEMLDSFAERVQKQLQDQFFSSQEFENSLWLSQGAGAEFENFTHTTLTDTGVRVVFPPYQIGPYALGTVTADISYKDMQGIIKDEYNPVAS